jgi:cytochrome c oxidase cbb3-type subunit 3
MTTPTRSRHVATSVLLPALTMFACSACRPASVPKSYTPADHVQSFAALYGQNCAGCHGQDGQMGPAPPLNDQLFLQISSDDERSEVIAAGRPGTLMPAFAESHGGTLTAAQVTILAHGLRQHWGNTTAVEVKRPRYAVRKGVGSAHSGQQLFESVCARCHGLHGDGGDAGPLHNASFLEQVSRQLVRRTAITGRPDLGMPDYRKLGQDSPLGRPLSDDEITGIVAYVESWRTPGDATSAPAAATHPSTRSEP